MIIGFPVPAIKSINGKKLLSPDAILNAGTILFKNLALSKSKGVDRNIIPSPLAISDSLKY